MGQITSHGEHSTCIAHRTHRLYDSNFVLALVSTTCFVIANTLMAHYSRWIEFLGGNLQQIGWVMGIGSLLGLLLRPTLALWINRIGARSMWSIGYLVFASSSLANLLLVDVGIMIYLLRSTLVLGAAIVFSSSLTYISQTAPADRRTEAIGILGVGGFMGMLAGPLLGDFMLGPGGRDRGGFQMLFCFAAFANVVALGLLLLLPREHQRHVKRSLALREFAATSRRHWPGLILLVDLTFGVCITIPFVFLANFIDKSPLRIDGLSVIGLFFWFYAGIAIVVRLGFRRLPDRIGPHRVLIFGTAVMSLGMFSYLFVSANHPWAIMVPALLTGAGHGLMFHTMTSLTVSKFPHELQGTGSTWVLMMVDMGMIFGAPLLGAVGEAFGFQAIFVVVGIIGILSGVVYGAATLRRPSPAVQAG